MPPTTSTTNPPISTLNPDVLLYIFTLNATPKYTGLTNLRHASQVCSNWRKLLLSSPALWGCAFDLEYFNRFYPKEWKAEVMRRTGTSRLRVQAHKETLIDMEWWIHSVLDEHWARIWYLELEFSRWCTPTKEWLSIFQRPAPSLKSFQVTFHRSTILFISSTLFDNNAPRLHTLSVQNASLDLTNTSWASNLRCLKVTSPFPLVELLQAFFIVPFPFLESLELADSVSLFAHTAHKRLSHHPISIPRLKQINIQPTEEMESSLSFLADMTPAPGCQLKFDASAHLDQAFILEDLPRVFNKYLPDPHATTEGDADSFFSAFFSPSMYSFNFSLRPLSTGPTIIDCTLTSCADSNLPGHAISALTTSMLALPLRKIKRLELSILLGNARSTPLVPHYAAVDAAVERFAGAVECVEELRADRQSLEWLEMFQKRTGLVVFPCATKRPM